jgi:hypothetical protein
MTFEEMQQIIERMLTVQAEMQTVQSEMQTVQSEIQLSQQALSRDVAQMVATHQEYARHTDNVMIQLAEVQQGMARWITSMDENQPTILARLMRIENKVDTLVERDQPPQ